MKTLSLFCCALVLGAGFSSCTQVSVKEPFGSKAAELDPDQWNGVWRMENGDPGMITVSKDTPGEFTFSKVPDPKEASDEESEVLTVAVREVDGDLFFTVHSEKPGGENGEGLLWGRIVMSDNTAVVWLPDVERFAALVKDGTLPGKDTRRVNPQNGTDEGAVELDKLEAKHLELIAKSTRGVLFAWDEPLVFVRVPWREEEEPADGE